MSALVALLSISVQNAVPPTCQRSFQQCRVAGETMSACFTWFYCCTGYYACALSDAGLEVFGVAE